MQADPSQTQPARDLQPKQLMTPVSIQGEDLEQQPDAVKQQVSKLIYNATAEMGIKDNTRSLGLSVTRGYEQIALWFSHYLPPLGQSIEGHLQEGGGMEYVQLSPGVNVLNIKYGGDVFFHNPSAMGKDELDFAKKSGDVFVHDVERSTVYLLTSLAKKGQVGNDEVQLVTDDQEEYTDSLTNAAMVIALPSNMARLLGDDDIKCGQAAIAAKQELLDRIPGLREYLES